MRSSYISLHTHSHYSVLDGLGKIDDLIDHAVKHDMPALAVTDHGVLYGAIEFYEKCHEAGIKPIVGLEAYMNEDMHDRDPAKNRSERDYNHITLLAKNETGFRNLIKLTSLAHLEGYYYKPRIDRKCLSQHTEGLIALSGCINGEIAEAAAQGKERKARELLDKYLGMFGKENFYLEIQHHPHIKELNIANDFLKKLSKEFSLKLVATLDAHYINPADTNVHEILLCLQTKSNMNDKDRLSMANENYGFRSSEEMKKIFKDDLSVLDNTFEVAEKCNLKLHLGTLHLPEIEIPDGISADEYLKKLCYEKLPIFYPEEKTPYSRDELKKRLEYELDVIKKTKFAGYILLVSDIVNWAKDQGIQVGHGRGSGAASIVSYLLNITNIDPLKYDLVFERFLNPERVSPPDFDLDFADDRRDEVLRYITKKYGYDHVAQIITFGTMAAKQAVRDVTRVLNFPYSFGDVIAKAIPFGMTINDAKNSAKEFQDLYKSDPQIQRVVNAAQRLEGVARQVGTHAAGIVIAKEKLTEYTPIQHPPRDDETIITQFGMYDVEKMGLVKIDILGLANLSILRNACSLIEKNRGEKIDIDAIPLDDEKTYALIASGNTTGVFQFESSGMRRYIRELKPNRLSDLIAMSALYRPGPMELIPSFINRKHGREDITYLHPKLEPILKETYGICVYQEQVLLIAREMAGFTLAEADILRKAVGKKIKKLLRKQKKKFIDGCQKKGYTKELAEKLFELLEPFARYGFNKAHATCYGLLAYQTAYLKTHYPIEYMTSVLINADDNPDRIGLLVSEIREMGIEVVAPHINKSEKTFAIKPSEKKKNTSCIVCGLKGIKNLGINSIEAILSYRKKHGAFPNVSSILSNIPNKDLNRKSMEAFILSGCFDEFGERGQLYESLDAMIDFAKKRQKYSKLHQSGLFANSGNTPLNNEEFHLKKAEVMSEKKKLDFERTFLGFYISEHPLEKYRNLLGKSVISLKNLEAYENNARVNILGHINRIKKIQTRKNETMMFAGCEDLTGKIELIIFPNTLEKYQKYLFEGAVLLVSGKISDRDNDRSIITEEIKDLSNFENRETRKEKKQKKVSEKNVATNTATANERGTSMYSLQNEKIIINIPKSTDHKKLDALRRYLQEKNGNGKFPIHFLCDKNSLPIPTDFFLSYSSAEKKAIEKILQT